MNILINVLRAVSSLWYQFVSRFSQSSKQTRIQSLIDTLRSGEFKQCYGVLCVGTRDDDGFYAKRYSYLGVACEVFKRETGRGRWVGPRADGALRTFVLHYKVKMLHPHDEVIDYFFLTQKDLDAISEMNNNLDKSFCDFADYIEKEVLTRA